MYEASWIYSTIWLPKGFQAADDQRQAHNRADTKGNKNYPDGEGSKYMGPEILKGKSIYESSGEPKNHANFLAPLPKGARTVGLGWSLGLCMFNKLFAHAQVKNDSDACGVWNTL